MTRREWRNVLLLALVVVVLTSLPYVLAVSKQGQDWQFSGFLFGVEDGNSYLGKMRLGVRGDWNFSLFYTPEAHDSLPLFYLTYLLPGQLIGRLLPETDPAVTPALILTFHMMRVVFDALLVVTIYRFCAKFLEQPRERLMATILAAFGGGLGWLLSLSGQSGLPADFYIPEGFSFLILFGVPHLALARAALLGGLLALLRTTQNARVIPARGEWGWLALAGVCWLVVGLSVPFYLAVVYAVLGAWGLAAWVKTRRFPVALFVRAVVAAVITLPLLGFYAIAFSTPVFAVWSAQNNLPSPSPIQYVLAYLPLLVLAGFGVRCVWQQPGIASALIIGWVLIVPLLVYLPLNVQRRLSEGVIVPLAILATAGLSVLARRRFSRITRGALVTAALLTSALLLLGGVLAALNPARPLFRPAAEIAALHWLNQHAPPEAIVLSAPETGNVIPAWTHLRTYMGHGPETIDWQAKTRQLQAFYAGALTAQERADFFANPCAPNFACAGAIRYVLWGPLERALAPDDSPTWVTGLRLVYDKNGYRIYEVMPETES